jgi:hypothetical protein
MRLLEPGFAPAERPARIIGRLRIDGTDPAIDDAIDAALARAGMTVREVELPHWDDCFDALDTIITAELWQSHPDLIDVEGISDFTNGGLRAGRDLTAGDIAAAMATRARWHGEVTALLTEVELLALPTLKVPPPPRTEWRGFPYGSDARVVVLAPHRWSWSRVPIIVGSFWLDLESSPTLKSLLSSDVREKIREPRKLRHTGTAAELHGQADRPVRPHARDEHVPAEGARRAARPAGRRGPGGRRRRLGDRSAHRRGDAERPIAARR